MNPSQKKNHDKDTVGIPVAFTMVNDNYYVYINGEPKYIRISNLKKLLLNDEKLNTMKKLNVMDLRYRYRLIHFDRKMNKTVLNQQLYNDIHPIDINDYDPNKRFIINAECVGRHIVLIEKERIYPIYVLNQNYIRFNHGIINIDFLHQFLQKQHFRLNNFIEDPKIQFQFNKCS